MLLFLATLGLCTIITSRRLPEAAEHARPHIVPRNCAQRLRAGNEGVEITTTSLTLVPVCLVGAQAFATTIDPRLLKIAGQEGAAHGPSCQAPGALPDMDVRGHHLTSLISVAGTAPDNSSYTRLVT